MDAKKYRNFLFEDALGSILDGFGRLLGASGGPLGACWAPLGRFLGASWALLGASWAPLGRPLGGLGRLLGASWAAWVPLRRILSDLKSILKRFRKGLGGIWMGSGPQNN